MPSTKYSVRRLVRSCSSKGKWTQVPMTGFSYSTHSKRLDYSRHCLPEALHLGFRSAPLSPNRAIVETHRLGKQALPVPQRAGRQSPIVHGGWLGPEGPSPGTWVILKPKDLADPAKLKGNIRNKKVKADWATKQRKVETIPN